MYMALTEEQAKEIRKLGISVIEWKNCVRKSVNVFAYVINKAAEKAAQAWKVITDAIDNVKIYIHDCESLSESGYIVKLFCNGMFYSYNGGEDWVQLG